MAASHRPKKWPKASYDPHYGPLVDAGPGQNRYYAPAYQKLDLQIFTSPLPSKGILTPFGSVGQRIMYVRYFSKDEML